jgi:hypothetical protein
MPKQPDATTGSHEDSAHQNANLPGMRGTFSVSAASSALAD